MPPPPAARPGFFVAGNPKSGTTALYRFLQQHPDLFLPGDKEPHHFATDWWDEPATPAVRARREAAYLELFAGARPDQLAGEASSNYLFSRHAAGEIARFDPTAKVIVLLREPVAFLASYHRQLLRNPPPVYEDEPDLARALALAPERRAGRRLPPGCTRPAFLDYWARADYVGQLRRLYAALPAERILILLHEEFAADNAGTMRRVFEFLGVAPDVDLELGRHNAVGGGPVASATRLRLVNGLVHGRGALAPVKAVLRAVLPPARRAWLREAAYRRFVFGGRGPALGPDTEADLRRRFAPMAAELEALTGQRVAAAWGYPRP